MKPDLPQDFHVGFQTVCQMPTFRARTGGGGLIEYTSLFIVAVHQDRNAQIT